MKKPSPQKPWSKTRPTSEGWWRWTDDENGEIVVHVIKTLGEFYQRWDIIINGEKVSEELQPCRLCFGRWAGPYDSQEDAQAASPKKRKRLVVDQFENKQH